MVDICGRREPRQLSELNDVFDFLEEVWLRPGMWVRSLDHLESMLFGYRVALEVLAWPRSSTSGRKVSGPFAEWLWVKLGRLSSLGWAAEIEREAVAANANPMQRADQVRVG